MLLVEFHKPFYGLKRQGTDPKPKKVVLIVIAWQPRDKGEPKLSVDQLDDLFFGPTDSVAHWFAENSQGRYQLVPHPTHPVIGPFDSVYPWYFYWRGSPEYVRERLCGDKDSFCDAWEENPYKVPPPVTDPHYHVGADGKVRYLDKKDFTGGHTHSWAEAIRAAAKEIDFSALDQYPFGELAVDECAVAIVKAQADLSGDERPVSGSDVPKTDLKVDGVTIKRIAELYAGPPHGTNHLAVAIEEVQHLAVRLCDQYPDDKYRHDDDPGRPGQLSLSDAGHRPVHTDPYHKLKWGWLNPQLADHSRKYTLQDAATTGDALILYSPFFGTEEFFILENRWRGTSYDRYRYNNQKEGLALWHCIQDPQLFNPPHDNTWARRAVHLRRADPRLDSNGQIQWHLTLFDGSDPLRGYDLHDDSQPQNLRFRKGMPSGIRIRNISAAGPVMTVDVEVPPHKGEIRATKGCIQMLRVHAHGTDYGPPQYRLREDCIIKIDSEPGFAFGIDLNGANAPAGKRMFKMLREAYQNQDTVRIEYEVTTPIGGRVIRVIVTD